MCSTLVIILISVISIFLICKINTFRGAGKPGSTLSGLTSH